MNVTQVVVQGTLEADGTLQLREAPNLPPGPVEVLIRELPPKATDGDSWWEYLQKARAELLAQGHVFRDQAEIDADRSKFRRDDEARRQLQKEMRASPE